MVVIVTECDDLDLHRSRIEGRQRPIPSWYELGEACASLGMWEMGMGIPYIAGTYWCGIAGS
jgi:hypothetical protein